MLKPVETADDLTQLADRYGSDKGSTTLCAHRYTEIYGALLQGVRTRPLRLLEIGLMHGHTQNVARGGYADIGCPSLRMWAEFLPSATIFGFDIADFRALAGERTQIFQGDQGDRGDLKRLVEEVGGHFDVIIDDGSHASHHQQITLGVLFRYLAPGGLYCIEDLHYQPHDMEVPGISTTRNFLRGLRFGHTGARVALEQPEIGQLVTQIQSIHFFDSQSRRWPLGAREDALAVIVKQGSHPVLNAALTGLTP
jgi:hypothetical protein